MKILVVEDDKPTASALAEVLTAHHYIVNTVADGQTGLQLVQTFEYDLILLDVILPRLDGISLCRQLRSQGYQKPILLLTVKDSSTDKAIGLNAGADDYMVKPFNLSELIARIRALLRRGSAVLTPVLTWENLQLDPSTSKVSCEGKLLRLTAKEYQLLELFLRNQERIFSRSAILEHLWSCTEYPGEDAVTTHVKGLRQKLKAGGVTTDLIETVYGLGYRLKSPPQQEKPTPAISSLQSSEPSRQQAEAKVVASLVKLWERFKDSFIDQVALLERVVTALQAGTLAPELQHKAKQEAHKLAGALGSFGFTEGSRLAREIEKLLQITTDLEQVQAKQLSQLVSLLKQELEKPPAATASASVCEVQSALMLVIDDDMVLTERIESSAIAWGFRVKVATNLAAAIEAIASHPPNIILLDLTFANSTNSGLNFLAKLTNQTPAIPVLVLTGHNSLADRVQVARLGGHGFLHKSVPINEILQAATQVLARAAAAQARVMVVDDDPVVLATLSTLLEPWGLDVTTLVNPQQFWEVLENSVPDLLILDVEMPGFSGIELCQVVRNDPRWSSLPVLFLSVHTDAQTVHQVFTVGADDYVHKPIVEPELFARVLNRLERAKVQRHLRKLVG